MLPPAALCRHGSSLFQHPSARCFPLTQVSVNLLASYPLQPLEFFLSASTGSLLVVAVAALRIYLAWKYVGDRLLTASLEYEETGW